MNIKDAILKNKDKALLITATNFSQDIILNEVADALNKGTKIIQYYFSNATDKENIELGIKLRQLCSLFDALLIINSRADIAQIIDSDGICLFEGDMSISQAKKIFHSDVFFAMYAKSPQDLMYAVENLADYVCIDSDNESILNSNLRALNKIKIVKLNRKNL